MDSKDAPDRSEIIVKEIRVINLGLNNQSFVGEVWPGSRGREMVDLIVGLLRYDPDAPG